ncbi:hypothetical protein, partial [Burkholderia sp. SIMBA_024]|uniref:hypothetical protein n=1 Tax=Burkholderia sp. SIMBA_024 TaxID=3085768 RepID=UPI00397C7027
MEPWAVTLAARCMHTWSMVKSFTTSQIATQLGVPHSTVYERTRRTPFPLTSGMPRAAPDHQVESSTNIPYDQV